MKSPQRDGAYGIKVHSWAAHLCERAVLQGSSCIPRGRQRTYVKGPYCRREWRLPTAVAYLAGCGRRVPVARHPAGPRYRADMAKRPRLTVLGSLNMDISVTVPRLPAPGATVLGSAAVFTPGGKGANQAVAAARLGAEVRMTGCVGGDDFCRRLLGALRDAGVAAEGRRIGDRES